MRDEFLTDAQRFIRLSAHHIKDSMTQEDSIQGALLFALGTEKLLKYVLARINIIFVLKMADFRHSVPSLYSHRMLAACKNDEIDSKPNSDVITFRVSLSRSKIFYNAANKHSQMLFSLAQWRDIIAHRPTSELDLEKVGLMLKKDAVLLIQDFVQELDIPIADFFGSESERLLLLSQKLTDIEQFSEKMNKLLESHKALWASRSDQAQFISQADEITASLMKQSSSENSYENVPCPACGKCCVIMIVPDYDYSDGESYITGVYVEILAVTTVA